MNDLVTHVKSSIVQAMRHESKITQEVLDIVGMSSPKVRHLLNNLCNRPGTRYLEIGSHFGSTLISAVYDNQEQLQWVTAIDSFVRDDCTVADLAFHLSTTVPDQPIQLIARDCFEVPLERLAGQQYNVYFYDGDHSAEAQKKALTYFDPVLADEFIFIVDDFRRLEVQDGTYDGLIEMGYRSAFDARLASNCESDRELWWNGLFIGVIQKDKS